MSMYFINRQDAGKKLAKALASHYEKDKTIILAMPRGGVPVAYEVACALHLPLDIMLVRKLGVPGQEELAMGAIANGNVEILNEDIIRHLAIPDSVIKKVVKKEHKELQRRNDAYRNGRSAPDLDHCTVILVDDGMATGANMRAAVQAASKQNAHRIIVATPVSSASAYDMLEEVADEVVSLHIPEPFYGVGSAYEDFSQTEDEEVRELLELAALHYSRFRVAGESACVHA